MPIDRKQLPKSAEVLQQMVLDLIARLDVLGRIAEHPVKRIEELLPHRWVPVAL